MPELKLVISNPGTIQENNSHFQPIPSYTEFMVDVKNSGSRLYEMAIQDPVYYLACNLTLEITETNRIVCHFPRICDTQLQDFTEDDDTLYWIFMIRFQMKILEQLLLFSSEHNVSHLIIYTDDTQVADAGVYQEFLAELMGYDHMLTESDRQAKFVIPTNPKILNIWASFMQETNLKLTQALWRNQRSSPVIRQYLKSELQ